MNMKIVGSVAGLVSVALLGLGGVSYFTTSSSKAPTPTPLVTTGGSTGGGYQQSGLTKEMVKATQIRNNIYTFQVAGGIPIMGGKSLVLNNQHYKDQGNLSCVVSASLLPEGSTLDTLRGRMVEAKGQLVTHPKYGEQFVAHELKVK